MWVVCVCVVGCVSGVLCAVCVVCVGVLDVCVSG